MDKNHIDSLDSKIELLSTGIFSMSAIIPALEYFEKEYLSGKIDESSSSKLNFLIFLFMDMREELNTYYFMFKNEWDKYKDSGNEAS